MAELKCSFCARTQSAVSKLISSPASLPRAYICDDCVAEWSAKAGQVPEATGRCSFCQKGSDKFRLFASPGDPPQALICEECLAVCRSIIDDDNLDPAGRP
jgi:ATP-dependent protease Clp ATPase subunit